jgi:hypothetical protein
MSLENPRGSPEGDNREAEVELPFRNGVCKRCLGMLLYILAGDKVDVVHNQPTPRDFQIGLMGV